LESLQQNDHEVVINYKIAAYQYRIVAADIRDARKGRPQYTVDYNYGDDG